MALSLAGIGQSKSKFNQLGGNANEKELPIVEDFLAKSALEFIEEVQKNIQKKGLTSKGDMSDLVYSVTDSTSGYTVEIGYTPDNPASKYYDYQNKGVAGVGKSISSPYNFKTLYPSRAMMTDILLWLRTAKNTSRFEDQKKGLSKLQKKRKSLSKYVDKSSDLKSLAYAISVSIKKNGITQTHFFDDAITKVFGKGFIKKASEALKKDISIKIINYGNNN
jgi:hypothetical protein